MHLMIFGAGYSGQAIAAACGDGFATISGTTRSEARRPALSAAGIIPYLYDGGALGDELHRALSTVTHLLQSIAPGRDGDPLLKAVGAPLRNLMPSLRWVGYLSTVGVYGDHKGAWVDEQTSCHPVSARSLERVAAEQAWISAGEASDLPVAVLRLSGIYGPGRNAFCNLTNGTARRLVKPEQVFNRIRVEDIGAATRFLIDRQLGGLYNVTDHLPCPPQDVVSEAARLMGVVPPPEQAFETAELSPMARSFYGENKRVSNRKICDLGFEFRFPEYRQSLAHLWSTGVWRG